MMELLGNCEETVQESAERVGGAGAPAPTATRVAVADDILVMEQYVKSNGLHNSRCCGHNFTSLSSPAIIHHMAWG